MFNTLHHALESLKIDLTINSVLNSKELERRESVVALRERLIQSFIRGEIDENTYKNRYNSSLEDEVAYRKRRGFSFNDVVDDERRRLDLTTSCADVAAAAAEKRREESTLLYSRECPICLSDSPRQRAVYACGHVICLACAEQMTMKELEADPICPTCRTKSDFVILQEKPKKEVRVLTLRRRFHSTVATSSASNESMNYRFYHEELCRLEPEISDGPNKLQLLGEAAEVAWRNRMNAAITKMRMEDEANSGRQYSRSCGVCCSTTPRHRSVFGACGHAVCRDCAGRYPFSCPICRTHSKYYIHRLRKLTMNRLILMSIIFSSAFVNAHCAPSCSSPNEYCGTNCELQCSKKGEGVKCIRAFSYCTCRCKRGYYRAENGNCVTASECEGGEVTVAPLQCEQNEKLTQCSCEQQCGRYKPRKCSKKCRSQPRCECAAGFYRNANGDCVTREECPAPKRCADLRCPNLCLEGLDGAVCISF